MADIANIRRRRLERLANNSVRTSARPDDAAEVARPSTKASIKKGGGIMEQQTTQDSTIPSEFECILCLRCVSFRHRGTKGGVFVLLTGKWFSLCAFFLVS